MDADEDDVQAAEDGEAVQQAPPLAEDVVDDEVVAGLGHARDRAVEAGPGPGQDGVQLAGIQLQRAPAGAHRVDGIDGQVEEGTIQDVQELVGDARLARAGRPVEKEDLPGPGCGEAHGLHCGQGPKRCSPWLPPRRKVKRSRSAMRELAYSSSKAALNMIAIRYAQALPEITLNLVTPGEAASSPPPT
ncbi:hypothetical protein Skr01_39340 [Sphaerisporangium krabiense]|uniref:SDR family oxidoreductase n=1 Tax=Sphaerisporangium krabiense TaxID=763782 RepID=A0A7W8Z981_9ACTN|nr:hypothetical protein [Sphaerisporangium krabiense]MBB5629749.1 hypothetical protein [Sphaerisporangium krabiense]GII63849.1 hypothetical protein Skr01_39340 [Sphaerisporangium krabiense]